jgi:lipopolysaccharide transport system permease protein
MSRHFAVIEARPKTMLSQLGAVWEHRSFYSFLLGEITMKKFRDTILGFWWLILRPLIPAAITIVLFTFVVPIRGESAPYPVFFLSGWMTWNVFQATVTFMPRTLLWMRGMMRRTYFPKLLVPLASIGPPVLELGVMLVLFILTVMGLWLFAGKTHLVWGWTMLWFPVCVALALLLAVAVGMVLSVVAVLLRDVVFTVPYFIQIIMLLTPVIYPVRFVPEAYRWILYAINPMASLVEVGRWALIGVGHPSMLWLAVSAAEISVIFGACVVMFLRADSLLADHA